MARLVKEGALSTEGELVREAARKPPIKKLQIQGKDFVQIIAKVSRLNFSELLGLKIFYKGMFYFLFLVLNVTVLLLNNCPYCCKYVRFLPTCLHKNDCHVGLELR